MDYENQIPPMTYPLSSGWEQPNISEILVDKDTALMTEQTMRKLLKYESSFPTAAYTGKMWRTTFKEGGPCLVMYAEELPNDRIKIRYRRIIII
jgi:hypothetical protein